MDQASRDAANHHNRKGSEAASSDSTANSCQTTPTNAAQQAQAAALGLKDPSALFGKYLLINSIW